MRIFYWATDLLTDWMNDRLINSLTDRPMQPTNWPTNQLTDWLMLQISIINSWGNRLNFIIILRHFSPKGAFAYNNAVFMDLPVFSFALHSSLWTVKSVDWAIAHYDLFLSVYLKWFQRCFSNSCWFMLLCNLAHIKTFVNLTIHYKNP